MTRASGPESASFSSSEDLRVALAEHSKATDTAYEQYWELRERGLKVDPKEFVAQFPNIRTSLFRMLAVHHFLDEHLTEDEPDWPMSGDTFGGFKLNYELGRGGIARVFKATELAVGNRPMVLKIAPIGNGEAATQGCIDHPNIVPVYSVATEEASELAAVCMPYLGRATLQGVLEKVFSQPEPPRRATAILNAIADLDDNDVAQKSPVEGKRNLWSAGTYSDGVRRLALQLAEALAFIHGRGICHQDLKPSNVLMRRDGTPMLMDFNLAADLHTPCLRLGGTPAYMPPEQIEAVYPDGPKAKKVPNPRSDLYSFGVILYQLLTGKHPFGPLPAGLKGWDMMPLVLERQKSGVEPIWKLRPDADRALTGVVEACLAYRPEDRPRSAADIVRILRRSDGFRARAVRWVSRRRKLAAMTSVLLVTMAAAGGYRAASRPTAAVAYAQLGDNAFSAREFRLAVAHYTESIREHQEQSEIFCARGKAYLELAVEDPSNYGQAEVDFNNAYRLEPKAKYKAFSAYCLHKQRAMIPAEALYQVALKAGFETAELHNNVGAIYQDTSQFDLAEYHLGKALEMQPKLAAAHYNAAMLNLSKALAAKKSSSEQEAFLAKGIAHVKEAARSSPLTGGLAFFGGMLCANAARYDESLCEPALFYLSAAVDHGYDPSDWANNQSFQTLIKLDRFRELIARRGIMPGETPSNTPRVVMIRD